jgi:hypothetical protein
MACRSPFTVRLVPLDADLVGPGSASTAVELVDWWLPLATLQGDPGPPGHRLSADVLQGAVLGLKVLNGAISQARPLLGIVQPCPRVGRNRLPGGAGAQEAGRIPIVVIAPDSLAKRVTRGSARNAWVEGAP